VRHLVWWCAGVTYINSKGNDNISWLFQSNDQVLLILIRKEITTIQRMMFGVQQVLFILIRKEITTKQ